MGKWKSHLYAILPHPTEAKIIMLSEDNNWFLPSACVNDDLECDEIPVIKKELEQEIGISIKNILYCAHNNFDKSKREINSIYVIENKDYVTELSIGDWIDLKTFKNLSLKFPEHKSVIEEYLTEIEKGNIPELRPPWAKTGWFDSASQWIEAQLSNLNYQQLSPVECIKAWGISCILRVHTNHGNLYLKEASTLPLFCNEPVVTQELKKLFPKYIPTVVGINSESHWMLLADFGEPIGKVPVKVKKDVYRLLAQIQIKSVEHIDNLLNIGCLDRRLEKLATQIDALLNDEIVLSQLKEAEIERLTQIAPHLKNLCSQLAEYKIPQTLVHGDLHLGNVALNNNNYLLFDWTDSCITHPFFDMFQFYFSRNNIPFLSPVKAVRDEYLNQWTVYELKSRVLEAWKLAKPLCALHHAVTYQYISNCLEDREKHLFSNALGNFIRELLKCKI